MNYSQLSKDELIKLLENLQPTSKSYNPIAQLQEEILRLQKNHQKVVHQLRAMTLYYEKLIESSMDMIISVDENRNIIKFNEAACKTFRYKKEEILGKHVSPLYHDPAQGLEVYKEICNTGSYQGEIINKRKNGESFISYLSASLLRDEKGKFMGIVGISREITKQKHAEEMLRDAYDQLELKVKLRTKELLKTNELLKKQIADRKQAIKALRESEERYRGLVEASPVAIFVLQDEKIVYMNQSGLELLGCHSIFELATNKINDLFSDHRENPYQKFITMQGANLPPALRQGKFIRKDGSLVDVGVTFVKTTYKGKPAIQGMARDITEAKRLREAAQRMERLAALGELATTIAHEVRNPLGSISLNFEFLARKVEIPETYQRIFEDIKHGIERIKSITDMILEFGRPLPPAMQTCTGT